MAALEFVMKKEAPPSLCEHWMPDDGLHEMSNRCWCNPVIDNVTEGAQAKTTVRHRPHQRGIA